MNTEEDEFKRIEREALRRAQAAEDDDTQVYTSNVALDNEQAAKIEQLEKKLAERSAEYLTAHITYDKGYQEGRQDAEDAHKEFVEPMTEVADRFAHRMALELECVLSDGAYSNKWYTSAMQVLSEYRSAMTLIHGQHSPTFMGEPKV